MNNKTVPFDMVALLNSEAAIEKYLSLVMGDDDPEEIIRAQTYVRIARSRYARLSPAPAASAPARPGCHPVPGVPLSRTA